MSKLTNILKGAGKGVVDSTIGLAFPLDNRLYASIQTPEEKLEYDVAITGVVAGFFVGTAAFFGYIN